MELVLHKLIFTINGVILSLEAPARVKEECMVESL